MKSHSLIIIVRFLSFIAVQLASKEVHLIVGCGQGSPRPSGTLPRQCFCSAADAARRQAVGPFVHWHQSTSAPAPRPHWAEIPPRCSPRCSAPPVHTRVTTHTGYRTSVLAPRLQGWVGTPRCSPRRSAPPVHTRVTTHTGYRTSVLAPRLQGWVGTPRCSPRCSAPPVHTRVTTHTGYRTSVLAPRLQGWVGTPPRCSAHTVMSTLHHDIARLSCAHKASAQTSYDSARYAVIISGGTPTLPAVMLPPPPQRLHTRSQL